MVLEYLMHKNVSALASCLGPNVIIQKQVSFCIFTMPSPGLKDRRRSDYRYLQEYRTRWSDNDMYSKVETDY